MYRYCGLLKGSDEDLELEDPSLFNWETWMKKIVFASDSVDTV